MEWTNRKVLVTGAGGFIGSHLVELLVRQGAEVTAFLHYNARGDSGLLRHAEPALVRRAKLYFGDLRDPQAVHQAMADAQIVFHLAALIGIPYSYVHPHDVVQTNVVGTLNVLTAARAWGVERLVHTSTSEVTGRPATRRLTRRIRCKVNPPMRPARSAPTSWPRASTCPTGCR